MSARDHAHLLQDFEHGIERLLDGNPHGFDRVSDEINQLRRTESPEQFHKDLRELIEYLHKHGFPNLMIVEDGQGARVFDRFDAGGGTASGGYEAPSAEQSTPAASGPVPQSDATPVSSGAGSSLRQGDTAFGGSGSLNDIIAQTAMMVGGAEGTLGKCLKGVQDTLESLGINLPRMPEAKDMLPILSGDSRFQQVAAADARPGDIAVYTSPEALAGSGGAGHITVLEPNGQEASDHVQGNIQDFGEPAVFRYVGGGEAVA